MYVTRRRERGRSHWLYPGSGHGWESRGILWLGGGGDTGYWGRDGSRGHSWGLMGDLEAWDAKW